MVKTIKIKINNQEENRMNFLQNIMLALKVSQLLFKLLIVLVIELELRSRRCTTAVIMISCRTVIVQYSHAQLWMPFTDMLSKMIGPFSTMTTHRTHHTFTFTAFLTQVTP